MRNWIIFLGMIIPFSFINAQTVDISQFNGMKMHSIGPAGMSGRVTTIDAINSDPSQIYIGTASGGVWKSENAGLSWNPLFDKQPVMGIGSLKIQQSNPDVIWVGTGEGNPRNSHSSGAGIYKSINGGRTWELMGLEKTKTIHRIVIDRDNPDIVYAGAVGSPWGANEERGVFKTINGGETWEKVLFVNDLTGCADLVMDPSNPNKLVAAMWEHKREPWFFNSGGDGSGLYITFDGGETWKKKTEDNGLPKGKLGRIGLAIAASNSKVIYALVESKEIAMYKSTDGGFNWKKVSTKNVGNRPFYYADIHVDPTNENRVFSLHTYITKSEDGGKSFEVIIPYTGAGVHPDHHAIWIDPNNSKHIIEGNDGGVNITYDGAKTWRFVENIPVAQFYHINIDDDFPYNIYGGMQDNGSLIGPSQVNKNGGISNFEWQEVMFGDGFDIMPDDEDNRFGYAMYQGGNVYYYDKETGQNSYIKPVHPDGQYLRFNWNAALAQDPHDKKGVYFGSQFVHYSANKGKDWKIISPDLTTNDSTKQEQHKSGGLTIDATQAENHTTILCIAPSPINKDVIWVGTDDGNLQLTRDGGKTWSNLSMKLLGPKKGFWIPQIEVSSHNEGEAYVIVNDYRRNDWKPYAYKTTDFGQSFTRIADEENVSGHALSIVQDPKEDKLLFLGTENGLYFSINKGNTWTKWDKGYPSVSTMDLKIQERENDLVIGTYGRAIYILDDIRPLRELATKYNEWPGKEFHVFDYGTAYQMESMAATGVRFKAGGYFSGDNQRNNAQIKVWIKEPGDPDKRGKEEETKGKSKKSKTDVKEDEKKEQEEKYDWKDIEVIVKALTGDTLFTYTHKADTGLQVVNWYLNEKGIRYPSRKKVKEDAKDPRGPEVFPGKYNLILNYGTYSDSTIVEVKTDPRTQYDLAGEKENRELMLSFKKTVDLARSAMERLLDAQETMKRVATRFELAEDSIQDKIKKAGKKVNDSIVKIQNLFMQAKGLSGYQDNSKKLNTYLRNAAGHLGSVNGAPTSTTKFAVKKAKETTDTIVKQINDFFITKWVEYQKEVLGYEAEIFNEYKVLKREE
jgi:photosystem II stability/assembly factor-like uncharacterized protein